MENVKMKRFIECFLPSTACNMKCEYCYITQNKEREVYPFCMIFWHRDIM